MKLLFEEVISKEEIDKQDSGQALIFTFNGINESYDNSEEMNGDEAGVFVRLQSWDTTEKHETFNKLIGKKVRVTIEVIE
jgi:hypothetical protein